MGEPTLGSQNCEKDPAPGRLVIAVDGDGHGLGSIVAPNCAITPDCAVAPNRAEASIVAIAPNRTIAPDRAVAPHSRVSPDR